MRSGYGRVARWTFPGTAPAWWSCQGGRTASLVEEDGVLVATGTTEIGHETVLDLIDALRR